MTKKFNYSLEGLRGLCAITVAFSHVQGNMILPNALPKLVDYLHFAHIGVLIFFVLSGYVIGVNYPTSSYDKKKYILKRSIRIYPIYLLVVLFSFLLEGKISLNLILTNLLMLQGWGDYLRSNVVLWSINYEILFYLVFLVIPHNTKTIIWIILGLISTSFLIDRFHFFPQILSGYAAGLSFWLAGLLLAKEAPQESGEKKKPLLSLLFLAMAVQAIAPGAVILNFIGLKNEGRGLMSITDIFILPFAILIISEAGNLIVRKELRKILYIVSLTLPVLVILGLIATGRIMESNRWIVASAFLGLALLCFLFKSRVKVLEKLSFWGSISYALYIIHYPLGFAVDKLNLPDSEFFNIISFVVWASLTVLLSWLLEKKFQPWARSTLSR